MPRFRAKIDAWCYKYIEFEAEDGETAEDLFFDGKLDYKDDGGWVFDELTNPGFEIIEEL